MDLTERLVLGGLRFTAALMILVGLCTLMAAMAVGAGSAEIGIHAAFLRAALTVAISSLAAGIAARHLTRWRMTKEEPHWARWQVPLALVLVLLSVLMVVRLAPLAALWRETFVLMRDADVWGVLAEGNELSAIVLAPIAAALIVPAVACAAAAALVAGTIASVVLLAQRNGNLPRVYLASLLIQAALIVSIAYGAALARQAGDAIERDIERQVRASDPEAVDVAQSIGRYDAAVAASASTLMWTLGANALVLVPLFGGRSPGR